MIEDLISGPGGIGDPSPVLQAPALPELTPKLKGPPGRSIADLGAIRNNVYDNVLSTLSSVGPVQAGNYQLRMSNLRYKDPDHFTLKDQKRAILRGETLARRLDGDITLSTLDGEQVDARKVTLARIPHLTQQGTFILRGVEYTLSNQQRLRPGIFTRQKENGELESHVNVLPGKGVGHRINLDPETGVFRLEMRQARLPLLPLLRTMGASDQDIRDSWGDDLYNANLKHDDPTVNEKLMQRLVTLRPGEIIGDRKARLRAEFERMELDPEVTRRTLGKPIKNVSMESMLETTKKLIAVNRGEAEVDDRDHAAYQHILGPEDIFAERARMAAKILRPLVYRSGSRGNLDPVQSGALSKMLEGAITQTGLGSSLEEVGPADILDQVTRVTRMGLGGIPSSDSIPMEARGVQPSQLGYVDPLRTPESLRIGVDSRFAGSVRKGENGQLFAPFRDPATREIIYKTPSETADSVLALPGEMESGRQYVRVVAGGKMRYAPRSSVQLEVPEMEDAFNHLTNMVPGKAWIKGQRVVMSSRFLAQALPLEKPEAPLVQSAVPYMNNRSYEEEYGKYMGAVFAAAPGVVTGVDPDGVTVQQMDGTTKTYETHNHSPMNRKTFLHGTAVVQPGQTIKNGDVLAKSNFTDDSGTTALGANFRLAYVPFRSGNFEDAIVISESAADRLKSTHMYQRDVEWEDAHKKGRTAYIGLFPTKFDRTQLESVDADGVVKPGTVLRHGDPIILAARQKERAHNHVSRGRDATWQDVAELWDHESDGIVTDVEKTKKGVVVAIQATNPMKVGDKLSNRSGGKGVVGSIVPDHEMPQDSQGRPFEVLFNPLGIITRSNPIQMIEAALGKVARVTGKPYKIHDFKGQDLIRFTLAELAKHGLSDQETITDPITGRKTPGVLTGDSFLMKLHHMAEDKEQGRGLGGYSAEGLPSKSKEASSKRLAMMDVWALLSHGAIGVLQDRSVRGHQDQDLWSAYMRGVTPPNPKVPHIVQKFYDSLRAAGINPVQSGSSVRIMGMTDKDVDQLAEGRYLDNAETVDGGSALKPVRGGLFDATLTGGHHGRRWSAIKLTEPMPNPIMEEPIRRMLGLTEAKFEEVLAGREKYDGRSGPQAIWHALDRIDLPAAIAETSAAARDSRKTVRDTAVRKLRYLKHAEKLSMHPRDWMMTKVPVLPPTFRPVSVMSQTGQVMVADSNYLYRELWEANENLRHMQERVSDPGEERLALYHSFRAVTGLDAPVDPKTVEKGVKGILEHIFGTAPKYGIVQRKMLSGPMDLVGRAVVTPDANLDMDQMALPEEQAWSIYTPFIVRKLARRGVPPVQAAKMVEEKSPEARKALLDEMGERPVWATRAPVLHKFGTLAFWPTLSKSNVMKFSPLVNKGFNLDHDGDAMTVHVPFSAAAVKNAIEKMMPSRNLFAPRDFKVHQLPVNEFQAGLYYGTAEINNRNAPRVFKTKAAAIAAWRDGDINADSRVVIQED